MIPDYNAVDEGLARATEILKELRNGDYIHPDYLEAKSLATVCTLLLSEVVKKGQMNHKKIFNKKYASRTIY